MRVLLRCQRPCTPAAHSACYVGFMRHTAVAAVLACALSALGLSARATVFRAVPIATLTQRADAVVIARRVSGLDPRAEMRGGRVYTTTVLEVSRVLARGPRATGLGPRVAVVLPGGVVDGPTGPVAQRVEGTPALSSDAWSVVLLHRAADGAWTVLNLSLGVLPLHPPSPGANDWRVMPPGLGGIELVDVAGRPAAPDALGIPPSGIALAEFVRRLSGSTP